MVLGNGFISHTIQEVEDTLRTLIKGNDLRIEKRYSIGCNIRYSLGGVNRLMAICKT